MNIFDHIIISSAQLLVMIFTWCDAYGSCSPTPTESSENMGPFLYHLQFLQLEIHIVGAYEVGVLHYPSPFTIPVPASGSFHITLLCPE